MSKTVIQPQDKYMVRFPDGMRDDLKKLAAENGRSLNAEIVLRLQRSITEDAFNKLGSTYINIDSDSRMGRAWKAAGKYDSLDIPTELQELKQDLAVIEDAIRYLINESSVNNSHLHSFNQVRLDITEALLEDD